MSTTTEKMLIEGIVSNASDLHACIRRIRNEEIKNVILNGYPLCNQLLAYKKEKEETLN